MKVSNLNNLKPAKVQPIWSVVGGSLIKSYKCMSGPNKGDTISDIKDYFRSNTLEIDDETA